MKRRIYEHNLINGFVFSSLEFAFIAMVVLPFGIYYFGHGRVVAGLAATGIAFNALTICVMAVRSWAANEKAIGVMQWFRKEGRLLIVSKYPHASNDAVIIAAATMLPFAVFVSVCYESTRGV